MVQLNFDANQVAPNAGFEPVPEGWYNVAIAESEMKPTANGQGAYLQLKMSIIDGPHTGKPIFARLNLQNQNQQAVDIAYGELSSICHVTGVFQCADSSQLHGIPFQVKVNVRKGTDDKGNSFESNDIKGYKDAAGNEPGKPAQAGTAQPGNFGGTPAPTQAGQPAAFGGAPQGQAAPQGQPAAQQPDPNQQAAPQGQATQPAQQQPAPQGNAGWTQQPAQDPNAGQAAPQGGAPWGAQGGQPAQ